VHQFVGIVMVPVERDVGRMAGWRSGPLAVELPNGVATDADARSQYFDRRAAAVLYGERGDTARLHRRAARQLQGGFELTALEWLGVGDLCRPAGVVLAHVAASYDDLDDLAAAWSDLVRWRDPVREKPELLRAVEAEIGASVGHVAAVSTFHVAFASGIPDGAANPFDGADLARYDPWLFALAAAIRPGTFAPAPDDAAELRDARIGLSSDWSAMVLRAGAAFVGHPDVDEAFVSAYAASYVATIYADAFLLGMVQLHALHDLADDLSDLEDPARHPRAVGRLDNELSRARNSLWWQHLTQHGPGNRLLLGYQTQHRLPELMQQLTHDLEDYARQASTRSGVVLNVIVAVFTLVSAIGVLIDLFRLYHPVPAVPSAATVRWAAAGVALALILVLAYPLGGLSRLGRRRGRPRGKRRRRRG
jgi:hypothetical protein